MLDTRPLFYLDETSMGGIGSRYLSARRVVGQLSESHTLRPERAFRKMPPSPRLPGLTISGRGSCVRSVSPREVAGSACARTLPGYGLG
jgi:hypothetical protein